MFKSFLVSTGIGWLLLSLAACGTEVVTQERQGEGQSGVEGDDDGGDGDGGGGEDGGEGDGDDDDGGEAICTPDAIPSFMDCCPGTSRPCFTEPGELEEFGDIRLECDDTGHWEDEDACNTPLVLSFDGREPTLIATDASLAFDLAGDAHGVVTDWPRATTPWLAIDRDGDGRIGDGRELFGSGTRLSSGARAAHGFEALAELDADHDGVVDAADPGFASLTLWSDVDADRVTDDHELASIGGGTRRILAIDLDYRVEARCDARGNCGIERATFVWEDERGVHEGEVVDVHLRRR